MRVNILEAKNHLSQLIKKAQAGDQVVIADQGVPVAQLVPVRPSADAASEASSGRAILEWLAGHRLPDSARRSAKEIDAAIEAEREAW